MKEKTIALTILIILITFYSSITIAQKIYFNSGDRNFAGSIENAMTFSKQGNWEMAEKEAAKVSKIWAKGNPLIALKYAESDYSLLNIYLAYFDVAVKHRDVYNIEKEGMASLYIYKNIVSIVPKP